MKSTDLMIGDWIREGKDGRCLRVIQLEGIITETIMTESGFDLNEDIEPIPLTPEILEKNGFRNYKSYSVYCSEDDRTEITIRFKSGIDITKNKYLEDEETFSLPQMYYVHQYQQALRLCGLTELANNFIIE